MALKLASIHIDMDSPDTLLRFWGFDGACADLDRFHEVAMTRALGLLRDCGVRATFFCIGDELDKSPVAAAMIRQAHHEGHEIANHTYSHPFGLTALGAAEIRRQIVDCSDAIYRVTGAPPRGFRAPGYAVNAAVLEILEELGFEYDSSAFWTVLHSAMRVYRGAFSGRSAPDSFGEASRGLSRSIYYPAKAAWTRKGPARSIVEIPLPRTRVLSLPFYSNFHLAAGALYRATVVQEGTRGQAHGVFVSRVEESMDRVLALLADAHVRATCFVLGEVAAAHPALVRKIAGEGHEVACHGQRHELVSRQSPTEFRADVREAKELLEDITGAAVLGYRAPTFSIGSEQVWVYDILLQERFRYDSSVYPIVHDRYGDPNAPRFPYEVWRNGPEALIEFPIGTARVFGLNLPIGGGGYFRLLPLAVTR